MLSVQKCECACQDTVTTAIHKTKLLSIIVCLLIGFFVTEWSVGLWSGSLSLQADAEHILSDVAALGISLLASWLARKPTTSQATFGHRRIEILAALVNGLSLLVIALFICWEAFYHLHNPEEISGLPMLVVATIGLTVNVLNITLLHPHSHDDLNLRGALLHVIADTASSLGVIVAAVVIHLWNWLWADAVVSLLVAGFTGLSALPLLRESLLILLEYAPPSIDKADVETSLKSFPQVVQVSELHIWRISSEQIMLCAHITVDCTTFEESNRLLMQLRSHLQQTFGIHEVTLQLTNRKFLTTTSIHPLFRQNLIEAVTSGQ